MKNVRISPNTPEPSQRRPCTCDGCNGCQKQTSCNSFGDKKCTKCFELRCDKCISTDTLECMYRWCPID